MNLPKEYIMTISKKCFSPLSPKEDDIDIEDIAHALSYCCRANGHFDHFFSIAQHSINCSIEARERRLSKKIQLACLLHDASEAYISDITRPVKLSLPKYKEIEKNLQDVIFSRFGLNDLTDDEFKLVGEIDDAMLYHEFYNIVGEKLFDFTPEISDKIDFSEKNFKEVKGEFLDIFRFLFG